MSNRIDTQDPAEAPPSPLDAPRVVAALPADDPVAATKQLTAALAAIHKDTSRTLKARYDDIGLLDAAAVVYTGKLLQEYLTTTRHTKQRESDLWNGAYQCWHEMAAAYAGCVPADGDKLAVESSDVAANKAYALVAAARGMRAVRRQLQWLRIRYARPAPPIWEGLARLYAYCESVGSLMEIIIYPGETSTAQREFIKSVALTVLTSDNLMPPEQDCAAHIVNHCAHEFVLSKSPDAACTHSFDLKHPEAPALLGGAVVPDAELRYFGAGAAVASLEEAVRALEQNQPLPASLARLILPVEPALAVPLLRQICQDWSGKPLERRHQREKTNARISVVPGFAEMVQEIARSTADPFDFTAKATGESWIASDISPDGFGVLIPAVSGDWVSVGSVAGIEGEAAGAWAVGIVRRVRRLEKGQQHIGVQVLCRNAQAVRVMREAASAAVHLTQRMPVDRGILLTLDAVHQKQIELLVSDAALYTTGYLHVVMGDVALLVTLREVLEVAADCSRISLTVLGVER